MHWTAAGLRVATTSSSSNASADSIPASTLMTMRNRTLMSRIPAPSPGPHTKSSGARPCCPATSPCRRRWTLWWLGKCGRYTRDSPSVAREYDEVAVCCADDEDGRIGAQEQVDIVAVQVQGRFGSDDDGEDNGRLGLPNSDRCGGNRREE